MTQPRLHTDPAHLLDASLPGGEQGYVLAVDDDAAIRAFLVAVLESAGYHVMVAADGAKALTAIEDRCPDLLLLDLAMPVMDGWTVHARLRQRGLDVPVIFMSAGYDAREEARRHQADGFLNKPFDVDDLLRVVGAFVRPPSAGVSDAARNA